MAQARQMLRSLLEGRLVCAPFDDGAGRGYTFAAIGTYRRFFRELEAVNVGAWPQRDSNPCFSCDHVLANLYKTFG